MTSEMTKDVVFDFFKNGARFLGTLALSIYGEGLNRVGEEASSDAIEIGIGNTIACLYDAGIDDREIIRVVNEQWGIERHEIEDRLVLEKRNAATRSLRQHLKLQGYSEQEITHFMISNNVGDKFRHNHELWKMKDNPRKMMKAVQEEY